MVHLHSRAIAVLQLHWFQLLWLESVQVLKKNDVDTMLFTAGKYKRTVTPFTETTQEAIDKVNQDIDEIHQAFKEHVTMNRELLNGSIDEVATGMESRIDWVVLVNHNDVVGSRCYDLGDKLSIFVIMNPSAQTYIFQRFLHFQAFHEITLLIHHLALGLNVLIV